MPAFQAPIIAPAVAPPNYEDIIELDKTSFVKAQPLLMMFDHKYLPANERGVRPRTMTRSLTALECQKHEINTIIMAGAARLAHQILKDLENDRTLTTKQANHSRFREYWRECGDWLRQCAKSVIVRAHNLGDDMPSLVYSGIVREDILPVGQVTGNHTIFHTLYPKTQNLFTKVTCPNFNHTIPRDALLTGGHQDYNSLLFRPALNPFGFGPRPGQERIAPFNTANFGPIARRDVGIFGVEPFAVRPPLAERDVNRIAPVRAFNNDIERLLDNAAHFWPGRRDLPLFSESPSSTARTALPPFVITPTDPIAAAQQMRQPFRFVFSDEMAENAERFRRRYAFGMDRPAATVRANTEPVIINRAAAPLHPRDVNGIFSAPANTGLDRGTVRPRDDDEEERNVRPKKA